METGEAQALIDMIGGAVRSTNFDAHKFEVWMGKLSPLDAELATKATLKGIDQWSYFPSWSEFYELYAAERNAIAREEAIAENAEATARPEKQAPEWVYVWIWARMVREPRDTRSFPQQGHWGEPDNIMSDLDYEALREEWEEAGRPKMKPSFLYSSVA